MKYSTYAWDLVQAIELTSTASCKRHQPHPLIPSAETINQEETKNPEKRSNSQQILSYCLGQRTQNPGLREVDLESSPKRGSDKINRLRGRRKNTTENNRYRTAWTHKQELST